MLFAGQLQVHSHHAMLKRRVMQRCMSREDCYPLDMHICRPLEAHDRGEALLLPA